MDSDRYEGTGEVPSNAVNIFFAPLRDQGFFCGHWAITLPSDGFRKLSETETHETATS